MREVSWTLTKNWTIICGSRRDREQGGGAGPPRESRRDQEQGGGAGRSREPWARMHVKGFCYPAGKLYRGGSYCGSKNLV